MATIVLSSVGAAVGSSIGGTVAGLSTAVIGRAVGATIGRVIDQNLLGQGSEVVETGKVDRFRLSSVGEGEPLAQIYGRTRLPGHVIWSSDFSETVTVTGGGGSGGKGGPSSAAQNETRSYTYTVSLAIAVCEGEVRRIGRIWADGEEIAKDDLNLRFYSGVENQLPDPLMEAIEGAGSVPAYRGTAYVVIENLDLEPHGNRVPQFSFEVARPERADDPYAEFAPTHHVEAVALIPGTGEYSLATTPVYYGSGQGVTWSANVNSPALRPDFSVSLEALDEELPNCKSVSLVVSWFGDDLRCGSCAVRPLVEERQFDGQNMPWSVSDLPRAQAGQVPKVEGRPVYGGTPADQSVIEAIQAIRARGMSVLFYPFILMEQLAGNGRPNPYNPAQEQPALPWRGRITLSRAPGVAGSPDTTAASDDEVAAFFGTVTAADFAVSNGQVQYTGPNEWSLSRFILHYAALCAAAGGVEAFCISSEMRGLSQIRGAGNSFPAVARLRQLAAGVRALVGPATKISYAADWSEYFGYQPQDASGDRFFHLDPLWADGNIDFIGVDNYMPLSDWRDGLDHLDAEAGTIYDLDYLMGNVAGGEGYDWFYPSQAAREAQNRSPIEDGAYGEPWVYRYKDFRSWWQNPHFDRIGGLRAAAPTAWQPRSKPIWFTEYGCAAIDRGTNQPNKFLDPKSSESSLPYFSNGQRDDLIQVQYLRAMIGYWTDPANNPISPVYGGQMIDMSRGHAWAWDARPYPYFPNNKTLWSDWENYMRGHWLNGRTTARLLSSVVAEICLAAGVEHFDTSELYGIVRGYSVSNVSDARSALQPLMLRFAFDAIERDGMLVFRMRNGQVATPLVRDMLAVSSELDATVEQTRASAAEQVGRVRLRFVQADGQFDTLSEEAVLSQDSGHSVSTSEMPLVLTRGEGQQIVERWLAESSVARETVRFALPPSCLSLGAGDVISIPSDRGEGEGTFRIDKVEQGPFQLVEAVRIENEVYQPAAVEEEVASARAFVPPLPVLPLYMDLPLISGDEVPHAPYIAITAEPWPGGAAVYRSFTDSNFGLLNLMGQRATIGRTQNPLAAAPSGRLDNGPDLEVTLTSGTLSSVENAALLSGANLAAIGDGSPGRWEVFQFGRAELVGEQTYRLSNRLRGQLGTDALMPDVWPEGSWFVLLNQAPEQMAVGRNERGVEQTLRVGPSSRPVDDPVFVQQTYAFAGNGLRPYAPVHLTHAKPTSGEIEFSWTRRTRIDGDAWDALDVPLGEEQEAYLIRVVKAGETLREENVATPRWTYGTNEQNLDGLTAPFQFAVAQLSSSFGHGPFARLEVD
ncbi:MAG: glycoside hydrolase TIM-barrel-like domain-containing protein [Pseudomonadota bacterium]